MIEIAVDQSINKGLEQDVLPFLTELDLNQLNDVGYAAIDADNDRTWAYVPPAGVAQSRA